MRIAIVGAGRAGSIHARLLRAAPGVDDLLVADSDRGRAGALAAELGGVSVDDPAVALEGADAVVIATPPSAHADLVRAAVARGLPVLCEKPLAEDLQAASDLAAWVESRAGRVQVGFQRRFDRGYAAARAAVETGRLGRLHLVRLQGTEPVLPPSDRTNLLRNTVIHDFDLARWLSGQEIESVYAEAAQRTGTSFDPRRDPDSVVVAMRLDGGALAAVSSSRLSPLGYDARAELLGSDDHIVIGWTPRSPLRNVEEADAPAVDRWQSWQLRFAEAYRAEIDAFLSMAAGGAIPVTVRDAVEAQRVADAVDRSIHEGRRIQIPRAV